MTTYSDDDLQAAYQLGYSHGINGQPPLENALVVEMVEGSRIPLPAANRERP